jgi:hypothetical protein
VYVVALQGLQLRVSADLTMICAVRDKWVVSNSLIRAGRDGALILSKSYGMTRSQMTRQN